MDISIDQERAGTCIRPADMLPGATALSSRIREP